MTNQIQIKYVQNLRPIFTTPKRIKIIVGGRGSTKSTGIADYVGAKVSTGELWCCARETQNSIEESVHRTILDEIDRLGIDGFEDTKTEIRHTQTGGRIFYRGLSRNITALKSTLSGIDGLWIEEGEDVSASTLRTLTASVRLNATDTERMMEGEDVKFPEIIITMNRGMRTGAIAQKWLKRAEKDLERCGYYEDDTIMVVQMNHTDMPRRWFELSGLEQERADDEERMSKAEYNHKWGGHYYDGVDGSIIQVEWFDAAIDAHLNPKFADMFKPHGAKLATHDPFDGGDDAGGFAVRHGSIITHVEEKLTGEIDEACDWATDKALELGADVFVWDADGMGAGLKRQVAKAFEGTRTTTQTFHGSRSGIGQDDAQTIYQDIKGTNKKQKTYAETFRNNRARYYTDLATRFHNTYKCVIKGEYIDPDEMISLSTDGIENMDGLRSELCRVPRKPNNTGLIQIMSKQEMLRLDIPSPNMGDCVMMAMVKPVVGQEIVGLNFTGWNG